MNSTIAQQRHIDQIAQNNVLLAKESENKDLDATTVVEGIRSVVSDQNKGFYLVIEHDNQIIGQLMVTYEWSDWRNKQIWWIQSVYVNTKWRKQGLFKRLLQQIDTMAHAHSIGEIRLYVHESNKQAQDIYKHIGMTKAPYSIYQLPNLPSDFNE